MTKGQQHLPLDELATTPTMPEGKKRARSGSFVDNMRCPIHRWFRFSAGYSADWATAAICELANESETFRVLDPFAGSGTTLLAADAASCNSWGIEAHPFVARVATIKSNWQQPTTTLIDSANSWLRRAKKAERSTPANEPPLIHRCFTEEALVQLQALRDTLYDDPDTPQPIVELLWLALTASLRPCSNVGTAQWQYILPNKTKKRVGVPYSFVRDVVESIANDIYEFDYRSLRPRSNLIPGDARSPGSYANLPSIDLVLTSPPYPNNYDYADSTRLEMTFWGEIERWADLQPKVRRHLICSCSQHSAADRLDLDAMLSDETLLPIRDELTVATKSLEEIRATRGGRKTYHTMIAAYFRDMAHVWHNLSQVVARNGNVCMVLGDCAPYGIYVPVDKWMAELAMAAGFEKSNFEQLRERNIKWKNRKHRVPLKEGRLWTSFK